MVSSSMFNMHLGVPGVFPDLLHSIAKAGMLRSSERPYVLPRKLFQQKLRGMINATMTEASVNVMAWRAAKTFVSELSNQGTVVISQHAMLGNPESSFKKKVLPYAEARVLRITDIFAAVPLTFHLTITNQFDYLQATMESWGEGQVFPTPRNVPSWADLVRRMKAAAPDRQIIVWDFERPEIVALAFAISMLNTTDNSLIKDLKQHMSAHFKSPEHKANRQEIPGLDHDLIHRLDAQYDVDLAVIEVTEGVSLIRPESIPEEFHL